MFFQQQADLFGWQERLKAFGAVTPWKPHALNHSDWPPDYKGVYTWRIQTLQKLRQDPVMMGSAHTYYKTRPAEFIMHWMDTYNPRKADNKWMPFVFFTRQLEFIDFLHELREHGESGLIEKCRDAGATWLACGYSIWSWLFIDDDAIGWGSRKQELVDKIGDTSSIFEKMRKIIERLPDIWMPDNFSARKHATFMKFINPENGSSITGETGDAIGRGGRTALYFKDEAAHYERPELIEAALGDNTNCQVDISSVNGLGNVFHRKREAGIEWSPDSEPIESGFTRVFIIDWSHHPEKNQEWYDKRKAKSEREGMQHIFAQEVERNYSASVQNTLIKYEWIQAAVDAHLKIPYLRCHPSEIPNNWGAGLDLADEGIDRNALTLRQWIIWRSVEEWGSRDVGVTTRRAIDTCRHIRDLKIQYDVVSIGATVKAEFNRLVDDSEVELNGIRMIPWNAGGKVINPFARIVEDDDESLLNKDMFGNMKAQAWWSVRTRFYKTHKAVTEGIVYKPEELISLDGTMPLLMQLMKELAQPTRGSSTGLRTIIEKKPDGTKSPDLADSGIMAFFPMPEDSGQAYTGRY